ncbi:MAG: polysaccharide biosynthesis protein [Peptostreptococcaceae bacterium]
MKEKESFLKGAFILGLAGIFIKLMGGVFRIPLGNFLGAEGIGYYQAAYPIYTLFLTLATAGFPTALAKLVSEKNAKGDFKGANKIFRVSHLTLLLTGIVSFMIFFFGADYIVNDIIKNPGAYYAMLAIAPSLLFVPVMSAYRGYFQGRRDMSKIALSQIGEQFFRVILGLALAFYLMELYGPKFGAAGAVMGATVGAMFSILYLIVIYLIEGKKRKVELEKSKHFPDESTFTILKKLLVVAVPITIGAAVMPLVNMIDTVLVIRRLEVAGFSLSEANAMFGQLTGMAMTIVNLPSVLTVAMSMSLVPSISESFARGDKKQATKDTQNGIKVTLLMVLPAAFGIASLAHPLMSLLYPNEPSLVGDILLIISPCVIFLGLIQTMNGILQGMGKPMVPVIALLVGMAVKVFLSYTLTAMPQVNIFGSAIGTVSAYTIAVIIEIIYLVKVIKIKFSIKDFVVKPLITVITMFVVVKLSYAGFAGIIGTKLATVVAVLVGIIAYGIVLIFIGGITKDEILTMPKGQKLYQVLRKIKLMK